MEKNKCKYIQDSTIGIDNITERSIAYVKDLIYLFDNQYYKNAITELYAKNENYHLSYGLMVIMLEGSISLVVNKEDIHVTKNMLMLITPGSTMSITNISDNARYLTILISEQMDLDSFERIGLYKDKVNLRCKCRVTDCDTSDMLHLSEIFDDIKKEISRKTISDKDLKTVILSFYDLLNINVIRIFNFKMEVQGKAISRQENLFREYINLLNTYSSKEREVKFYAAKLGLSPKYLSSVTIAYSGKNASQWIDEYVVAQAIQLMREKNYKIQQISDMLNFPSQSFFGRYFKRVTGVAPKRYMMREI